MSREGTIARPVSVPFWAFVLGALGVAAAAVVVFVGPWVALDGFERDTTFQLLFLPALLIGLGVGGVLGAVVRSDRHAALIGLVASIVAPVAVAIAVAVAFSDFSSGFSMLDNPPTDWLLLAGSALWGVAFWLAGRGLARAEGRGVAIAALTVAVVGVLPILGLLATVLASSLAFVLIEGR